MNGPRCSHRGRRPSRLAFREHLRVTVMVGSPVLFNTIML